MEKSPSNASYSVVCTNDNKLIPADEGKLDYFNTVVTAKTVVVNFDWNLNLKQRCLNDHKYDKVIPSQHGKNNYVDK